jgi:hypothetical protein
VVGRRLGLRGPAALVLGAGVLFAATAAGFLRLLTAPGDAADSLDRRLDEWQRLVRDRAYRTAYYAWTAVFAVLNLGLMYAAGNADAWLSLRDAALFMPLLTEGPAVVGRLLGRGAATSDAPSARQQLVQQHAQRKHVGLRIAALAPDLLGRRRCRPPMSISRW